MQKHHGQADQGSGSLRRGKLWLGGVRCDMGCKQLPAHSMSALWDATASSGEARSGMVGFAMAVYGQVRWAMGRKRQGRALSDGRPFSLRLAPTLTPTIPPRK